MDGANNSGLHLTGIVLAVLVLASGIFRQQPLQTDRPDHSSFSASTVESGFVVPARLWEDPFEAVERYCASGGNGSDKPLCSFESSPSSLYEELSKAMKSLPEKPAEEKSRKIENVKLVLASQITSPYAEVREHRIRTRAAVLAGFARMHYAPQESEHIGLVSVKVDGLGDIRLPYEFFLRRQLGKPEESGPTAAEQADTSAKSAQLVALLWLPEKVFSVEEPVARLQLILESLFKSGAPKTEKPTSAGGVDIELSAAGGTSGTEISLVSRAEGENEPEDGKAIGLEAAGSSFHLTIVGSSNIATTEIAMTSQGAAPEKIPPTPKSETGDLGPEDFCTDFDLDSETHCLIPVLGPMTSDTLRALADDLDQKEKTLRFRFFAATPTAPGICEDKACDQPSEYRSTLVRTIATDDELIEQLLDELRLRGADPVCTDSTQHLLPRPVCRTGRDGPRKAHVVLISEWDTAYGRTLPVLFCKAVNQRLSEFNPDHSKDNDAQCHDWIHRRGYERGLDGKVPLLDGQRAKTSGGQVAKVSEGALRQLVERAGLTQMEPAVGPRQLDYIRRLATELKRFDRELKTNDNGSIRAFGILGNDVYDKLLIIQALREHFPNHLYFTTDLDARFLTPKHYPTVRNLVVASAYGLQLNRDLQGFVPPFRNAYQTSNYLTTLAILNRQPDIALKESPRIFEVGRNQFVNLSEKSGAASEVCRLKDIEAHCLDNCSVHPPPGLQRATLASYVSDSIGSSSGWIALTTAAVIGLMLMMVPRLRAYGATIGNAISVTLRQDRKTLSRLWCGQESLCKVLCPFLYPGRRKQSQYRFERLAVHIAILIILMAGVALHLMNLYSEVEPFAFAAGVSLWPAELIRLLANILCVAFIFTVMHKLASTEKKLAKRFDLPLHPVHVGKKRQGFSHLMRWYLMQDRSGKEMLSVPERNRQIFTDVSVSEQSTVANRWEGEMKNPPEANCRDDEQAETVWCNYRQFAQPGERLIRTFQATVAFFSIYFILLIFVAPPLVPFRGDGAYYFALANGFILTFLFGYLLFLVLDETTLCVGLIRNLSTDWVCWPDFVKQNNLAGSRLSTLEHRLAEDISTAEFIAERSKVSGDIVWYPFVILILGVISLSTRFDNMATPAVVIGLIGFALLFALSSGIHLRHGAREARAVMTEKLEQRIVEERHAEEKKESARLEMLKQRIERLHSGAFRRIYEDPIARALAWLFSISAVIISEYYSI